MSPRDVAVVGMACVFPGANDVRSFWRNIAAAHDAVTEIPSGRWPGSRLTSLPPEHEARIGCTRGGFISTPYLFDPLRHRVMPKIARHGDVDQFILLDILSDALADAGIADDHRCRASTDVIVGRGNYTSNKMLEVFFRSDGCDRILAYLQRRLPQLTDEDLATLESGLRSTMPPRDADGMATAITNLSASRAANRLNLGGAAFAVDAACASSLIAMEMGVDRLRAGKADVALVAGINFTSVPGFWYLFSQLGAFSPSAKIRPFDRRADGLLIGEGAGAVVLKRAEDAARDGDRVYALVKGLGSASDGRSAGILAPSSKGQVPALERAYRDADVDPSTIGLLEAHGTGTSAGDRVEIETLREVFGPPTDGVPTRVMGSVKSMIGHTMPAAGIASFIKTVCAVSAKILPPSLHCDEPDPALADLAFFVSGVARPWLHDPKRGPRRAAVNAFGFGGINAHVILEEVREETAGLRARPVRPGVRPPAELLAFSAGDRRALAGRLREVAAFLRGEGRPFELEDLAFTLSTEVDVQAVCRLALIRESTERLDGELLELAGSMEKETGPSTDEQAGVFFGESEAVPRGHIAAVFPGIGFPGLTGDFPDHLLTNCMHFPVAREAFDLVEDRDRHPGDPLPTSILLVPPPHLPEERRAALRKRFAAAAAVPEGQVELSPPDERNLSHMGTLVNNWASWRILQGLGIPVDMLCGQSLGDLSAVLAAGMVDYEECIPGFWQSFNLEVPYVGSGSILMVGASEEELAPLLEEVPHVSIAIHLSPSVQVVGGSETGIDRLAARLRRDNVFSQKLPFPPIHTPRLREYQEALTEAIGEGAPLKPARITLYSAALAAPMPEDPERVGELLRSNVSQPIRFWQTQRRMVADGARFIVQIGSGTLAASSRTVLERDDVLCVATDVGERHPVTQIQTLCAHLFASGLQLDLAALLADREPRRLALDAPGPAPSPPATALPLTIYWPPLHVEETESPSPAPQTPVFPFLGEVLEFTPGKSIVATKTLRLDEHLYLADHVFLNITEVKPLPECGAVLPLTFTLELLAQTAAYLAPGLGPVGVSGVRARRWIAFEDVDALDVRVEAGVEAGDGEAVSIGARASVAGEVVAEAVFRFAPHYRETLSLTFHEPADPRTFPLTAAQVYEGRYFFHGPSLRCLTSLNVMGDRAATAEMVVRSGEGLFRSTAAPRLLFDPVVLDGAGQAVGAYFLERDISVLPVSIDQIEFYRTSPPTGTRVPVRVEFTEIDLDGRRSKANIEVQDGDGHVWFRVAGWQDLLYLGSPAWNESQREPGRRTLSAPLRIPGLPGEAVVTRLTREDVRHVPPLWLARAHLHSRELAAAPWSPGEDPGRFIPWMLGRVAAKDAVRRWQAARRSSADMAHTVEVIIANETSGRPHVESIPGGGPVPVVSLAHDDTGAVAVAADRAVGIDLERIDAAAGLRSEDFTTREERALLGTDGSGLTRLWCAKEAASKALGTGLAGRPREFEVVEAGEADRLSVLHRPSGRRLEVHTGVVNRHLVAVAVAAPATVTPAGSRR